MDQARFSTRDWQIVLTLCAATLMIGVDFSIVAVAMPDIGADLGFESADDLQWVATACLLPTASLLPLGGRLADLFGRRRMFMIGIAGFAGLSLVAALATSPAMLLAGRAGQGVAASLVGPAALALLTTSFAEGPARSRALGLNGAMLSLGFVIGTIGGGLLTSALNWRWTMLVLVGTGAAVLVSAALVLPRTDLRVAAQLDLPGAALSALGLCGVVYAVSTGRWTSPVLALALLALVAFAVVESRHRAPLIPLPLLRSRTVGGGGLIALVTFGMCGGTTLLLSVYLQEVLGLSALAAGFAFLAEGVAAFVAGGVAGRYVGRGAMRTTLVAGLVLQGVGTAALALLPASGGLPLMLLGSGVMGFGHVLAVVAVIATMTSCVADEEQAVVGGLAQLPLYVSAVLMAVLAAIAAAGGSTHAGIQTAAFVAGIAVLVDAAAAYVLLRPVRETVDAATLVPAAVPRGIC